MSAPLSPSAPPSYPSWNSSSSSSSSSFPSLASSSNSLYHPHPPASSSSLYDESDLSTSPGPSYVSHGGPSVSAPPSKKVGFIGRQWQKLTMKVYLNKDKVADTAFRIAFYLIAAAAVIGFLILAAKAPPLYKISEASYLAALNGGKLAIKITNAGKAALTGVSCLIAASISTAYGVGIKSAQFSDFYNNNNNNDIG